MQVMFWRYLYRSWSRNQQNLFKRWATPTQGLESTCLSVREMTVYFLVEVWWFSSFFGGFSRKHAYISLLLYFFFCCSFSFLHYDRLLSLHTASVNLHNNGEFINGQVGFLLFLPLFFFSLIFPLFSFIYFCFRSFFDFVHFVLFLPLFFSFFLFFLIFFFLLLFFYYLISSFFLAFCLTSYHSRSFTSWNKLKETKHRVIVDKLNARPKI